MRPEGIATQGSDRADPYDLQRFLAAQQDTYATALSELRRGRKTSHWMWFIFPQVRGLGRSSIAQHYALASLDEARAYLAHAILGQRLRDSVGAMQDLPHGQSAAAVLGDVDAIKFRSSLTLFEAAGGGPLFGAALDRWFDGARDETTLTILAGDIGF